MSQSTCIPIRPYPRTDLHAEMVVMNALEVRRCNVENPRMRDYTLFSMQEPCVLCTMRLIFSQVGQTYWVYRDMPTATKGGIPPISTGRPMP